MTFNERVAHDLLRWRHTTEPVRNVYESYDRPVWLDFASREVDIDALPDFSRDMSYANEALG